MKIIRNNSKIIFLNGFMAQELGKLEVAEHLEKNIPGLYSPRLRSNPEFGLRDLEDIKRRGPYEIVIGLSMGGVYAIRIPSTYTILINPGFGISEGIKTKEPRFAEGFKKLEDLPILAENVTGFIAIDDKIRFYTEPVFKELFGKKNLINYPGKHVPTIEELDKYIIPKIKKLL